jgi:hypothetical protein
LKAICLLVAGIVKATLPTTDLTLAWQHSVERTRWEEHYRVVGDRLDLLEARVQAMGAGMEPGAGAELRDGWWTWRPATDPMRELRLSRSPYTADYDLCWNGECRTLTELAATGSRTEVVTMRACSGPPAKPR